jgi:integrase
MNLRDAIARWQGLQGIGKKPRTLDYHREIARVLRTEWAPLLELEVGQVTDGQCLELLTRIDRFSTPFYNAIVSAARKIVPAARVLPRKKVPFAERYMLSPEEFDRLLEALDGAARTHAGLVVRFLALSGMRIEEASLLEWAHVAEDRLNVPSSITKNGRPRAIPFIEGMPDVLAKLREVATNGRVLPQKRCYRTLRYACRLSGLPRLGHHSFRHLFATRCIESGVDVPTVARWMGHRDGGALLMKTYAHLLDDHSRRMAAKVVVGGPLRSVTGGFTRGEGGRFSPRALITPPAA